MGVVAVAALAVAAAYMWRFGDDHGVVSFLLAGALLLVAVVHGIAWRQSRTALLVVDMTGLRVRVGGGFIALPWSEVEHVDVARRRRLTDGRLAVHARDERRVLASGGIRCRFAVALNRWLYDAALVVPYGLSTRVSVDDIPATLRRLADGRVQVVEVDDRAAEPEPTVEVTGTARPAAPDVGEPTPEPTQAPAAPPDARPAAPAVATPWPAAPGRLAGVVSALRSQSARGAGFTMPIRVEPATVGMLALSPPHLEPEPLPELEELRRRGTSNVELVIDATADLSAKTMPKVHRPAAERLHEPVSGAAADPDTSAGAGRHHDRGVAPEVAIGDRIRDAREWLGISVDDLAERTRIRPFVIESVEVGDFTACGGDFYARGHLRMLAGVLGIEAAPLLASYDEHVATAPVSPRAVFDADLSRGVVRPTGGGSRWGVLVATVVVVLVAWGLAKLLVSDPGSGDPSTSGSTPAQHSPGSVQPKINDPAIGGVPPATAPPTHLTVTAAGGSSRVVVRDAAMKVIYQGTLQSGQSAGISGQGPLRVMAADGGVVSLTAPGHPASPMGAAGHRAFRRVSAPPAGS